jgi:hypothetical protein
MGSRQLRQDIPINLPNSFKDEARELRNKLLLYRFHRRMDVKLDESLVAQNLNRGSIKFSFRSQASFPTKIYDPSCDQWRWTHSSVSSLTGVRWSKRKCWRSSVSLRLVRSDL